MHLTDLRAGRSDPHAVVRFTGHTEHSHEWAQLVYVAVGSATVRCARTRVDLQEQEGVWLPAGEPHALQLEPGGVVMGPLLPSDPPDLGPLMVSGPELSRIMTMLLGVAPRTGSEIETFREALHTQLLSVVRPYFVLPTPRHHAAAAIARQAVHSARPLAELAAEQYISARQAQRLFLSETGRPFGQWRRRARLNRAIAHLRQGHGVSAAQKVAGFASRQGIERAMYREAGRALETFVVDPVTGDRWNR